MLASQRRKHIIERIEQLGTLSNTQAASEFGVSMLTIRRDLDLLEQQGLIRRVHGGAQASRNGATASLGGVGYDQRLHRDHAAKLRIGARAAELVQDGETIFLDAGTTTIEIARALKTRPLRSVRVVTHAVNIAAELVGLPQFRVFSIGGEIFEETYASTGQVAVELLSRYSYDRFFLACMGFDPRAGITNARLPEVEVKVAAMHQARWTGLVADASKWGVHTFARIAPLGSVQAVVSDERLPPAARAEVQQLGLDLMLTP